jgi:hypothetical protein
VGSIPAILVILFLQNNLLYPRNKRLNSFRRRKKTINFRIKPLNSLTPHGLTTFKRWAFPSGNLSRGNYLNRIGVLNWVKLRKTKLISSTKTHLVAKSALKSFSLIPSGITPTGSKKRRVLKRRYRGKYRGKAKMFSEMSYQKPYKPSYKIFYKNKRFPQRRRLRRVLSTLKRSYAPKRLKFNSRYGSPYTSPSANKSVSPR